MIVGNDEEFGFMAGGIDKGLAKARELAGSSASIVVYKMGPEGAVTFANGEEVAHRDLSGRRAQAQRGGRQFHGGAAGLAVGRPGHPRGRAARFGLRCNRRFPRPGCAPAMPDTEQLESLPHIPSRPHACLSPISSDRSRTDAHRAL
jgi:5-dehydro-2-deoxygluconokinase